jgi:O-antigen ligase
MPFWAILSVLALVPGHLYPWSAVAGVPIMSRHLLVPLLAVFYLLVWWPPHVGPTRWHRGLPMLTVALIAYMGLSMVWSGMGGVDRIAMSYVLVLNIAAICLAYCVLARMSRPRVRDFLTRLTFFLAAVSSVYFIDRAFLMQGRHATENAMFGMYRVDGPLYGSAQAGLLPAIGWALQQAVDDPVRRRVHAAVAVILVIVLLGTASRSAYALLGLFVLLAAVLVRSRSQRRIAIVGLAAILPLGAIIVFSRANVAGVARFSDTERALNHLTSFSIIAGAPTYKQVLGSGYGSWWPWYMTDVEEGGARATGRFMQRTPYGLLLHQPHSVLLYLAVETGLVGLAWLAYLWLVLGRLLGGNLRNAPAQVFACGLFAGAFTMFADFVLLRPNAYVGFIFWIYLFGVLALRGRRAPADDDPEEDGAGPATEHTQPGGKPENVSE